MGRLVFYMPGNYPGSGVFGAATLGLAGRAGSGPNAEGIFENAPQGLIIDGSYEECLERIPGGTYQAAIVLLGNAGGENIFLRRLQEKLSCPIVGGGAAMAGNKGGFIARGGQANILLINDPSYEISTFVKNIHHNVLGDCDVEFDDPRVIRSIDGVDAAKWLARQKKELGLAETDFEHLTLSDVKGVNAHLSWDGKHIVSGRDLERKMQLRYVPKEEVYTSVLEFYDDGEDTLVFGCAGLKGITGELPAVKSLGLYLYGEICMMEKEAIFGNLMLSKIRMKKR